MKIIFTFFTLFFTLNVFSQDVTGIWRGKFQQTNVDGGSSSDQTYKYEVQINNKENGALEGVTYSYLTTVFYGKASLKGIINNKSKIMTIKETMMLDLKASGRTEPCLMTCYLDYKKVGNKEVLSGTYTSINAKNKSDCGVGTVYLEKVTNSDFNKESFITKKEKERINNKVDIKTTKTTPKKAETTVVNKTVDEKKANSATINKLDDKKATRKTTAPNTNKPSNSNTATVKRNNKPTNIKPKSNETPTIKEIEKPKDTVVKSRIEPFEQTVKIDTKPEITPKILPVPTSGKLIERENKLINTFIVNSKEVTLEFYDNGLIDNDTISVFKDNVLVIDKRRLSVNPITLTLKFDDDNQFYEIVTVAENLGDEPPNTALMIMNYGKKRREVGLTSDLKTNAKFIVKYEP